MNGDGIVDAEDATLISEFSSEVGAGNYSDCKAGWSEYMLKHTLNELKESLSKIKQEFIPITPLT
ncbi:MAG: hypothetical protein K2O52_03215 [Oscillospiraceae bacterium]|nr:hypothetical protein [Oscillospiraceae bacterium]